MGYNSVTETMLDQVDRSAEEIVLEAPEGTSRDDFIYSVMPYFIGHLGPEYGLVDVGYVEKRLTFHKTV